jgi:hypothetical protein
MSRMAERMQELGAGGGVDVSTRIADAARRNGQSTARTPAEDPRIRATPGM